MDLMTLVPGEPTVVDVLEQTTPRYTAILTDDEGNSLPATSLTALTLSLYVIKADGTIAYVNSRNAQNVLNTNDVSVGADGTLIWQMVAADLTLIESLPFERHIALFTWTWSAGTKKGRHEIVFTVKNLQEVS